MGLNQSGAPLANDKSSPTQVGTDTTWSKVSLGKYNSYATKTNGSLWAWGANSSQYLGSLGLNTFGTDLSSPTQIPGTWTAILGNGTDTAGIKEG